MATTQIEEIFHITLSRDEVLAIRWAIANATSTPIPGSISASPAGPLRDVLGQLERTLPVPRVV